MVAMLLTTWMLSLVVRVRGRLLAVFQATRSRQENLMAASAWASSASKVQEWIYGGGDWVLRIISLGFIWVIL